MVQFSRLGVFLPVLLTGEDARSFLQALLTCDLRKLTPQKASFGAHNTPQGHARALITLIERKEGIFALLEADLADELLPSFRKRILRSKVSIEAAPLRVAPVREEEVRTLVEALPQAPGDCVTEGDCTVLRWWGSEPRFLLLASPEHVRETLDEVQTLEWRRSDIRCGVPRLYPPTQGTFIAQMLNLDVLGAVSYDKGCYLGQEAVGKARRSGVPRRLFRFASSCQTPAPGTPVACEGVEVGPVVDAVPTPSGCELLAVVDLGAHQKPLKLSGQTSDLQLLMLPYDVPKT